jgi:hypothetical protein
VTWTQFAGYMSVVVAFVGMAAGVLWRCLEWWD